MTNAKDRFTGYPDVQTLSKKEKSLKKDAIVSLLINPRNRNIRFSSYSRCFKLEIRDESTINSNNNNGTEKKRKEIILSGLLPSLKRVFWPDYQYIPTKYGGNTGVRSSFEGRMRGTLVHDQIRSYINESEKDFLKKHETLHFYTKKAIIAMKEWELRPIAAEFIIYDEDAKIATSIDALCIDKNYDLVIIDWKCGYDHFIMRATCTMKGPLENKYSDCPLHQAYLQVLMNKVILEKFYGINVNKCYVVQITKDGISNFSPPSDFIENRFQLYDYMVSTIKKQKLMKKEHKKRRFHRSEKKTGSKRGEKKRKISK
jgi:hypothetical protein